MKAITMQIKNQDNLNMGGAYERYITLMNGFLNEGFEVHHISPRGFSNITHRCLIHHGIRNIRFNPNFLPFFVLTFLKMREINKKNDIDFIITFSSLETVMGVIFKKTYNKKTKIITCFRGDTVSNYEVSLSNGLKKTIFIKFQNIVDKIALKNGDLSIFLSKVNRDDILKRTGYNNKKNMKVVYNGITPRLQFLSGFKSIKFPGSIVIGFVGLLYEGKGVNFLIEAFYNVKKYFSNAILVIVGDGPDKYNFIKLVEDLGLQDVVIFTGYKKNPIKYIKGFDLLIVPSLSEAFGMVILEALYVGTPVIGSKVGGIPEVLKYDELLFNVKTEELEFKILNVFKNKESYENVSNLCKKRKDRFMFDWTEEMIESIKAILEANNV